MIQIVHAGKDDINQILHQPSDTSLAFFGIFPDNGKRHKGSDRDLVGWVFCSFNTYSHDNYTNFCDFHWHVQKTKITVVTTLNVQITHYRVWNVSIGGTKWDASERDFNQWKDTIEQITYMGAVHVCKS